MKIQGWETDRRVGCVQCAGGRNRGGVQPASRHAGHRANQHVLHDRPTRNSRVLHNFPV